VNPLPGLGIRQPERLPYNHPPRRLRDLLAVRDVGVVLVIGQKGEYFLFPHRERLGGRIAAFVVVFDVVARRRGTFLIAWKNLSGFMGGERFGWPGLGLLSSGA
jgi:hypothetical protein